MKIRKSPLPTDSLIAHYPDIDYSDSFCCNRQRSDYTPEEVMVAFWSEKPAWIRWLYKLRNLLVKPFGLKTDGIRFSKGQKSTPAEVLNRGVMRVVENTPREIITALNDKHLVAFVSIFLTNRTVYISTAVRYHNRLGTVYFALIKPFHKIVVRSLFRHVMQTCNY